LIGMPWANRFEHFMEPSIAKVEMHHGIPVELGLGIGALAGAIGIFVAYMMYSKNRKTGELLPEAQKASNPLYQGSVNLWYFDRFTTWLTVRVGGIFASFWAWFDRNIVDGIVNLIAGVTGLLSEMFRKIQTGYVGSYATLMLLGVVAVVFGLLWPVLTK
jgi:NADH-quinone oxidoreductase subunit L